MYWLLALALVVHLPVTQAADDPQATAQQLKDTLARLNALDQWFSEAEKRRTEILADIQQQDQDIDTLNQAVARVTREVGQTREKLSTLREQNKALSQRRKTQANLIGEHLASAYRLTGQDFLKQLLNQESPDDFERMIRYHRYFSESRLDMLEEYQATLAELAETNRALSQQEAKQTAEQKELEAEQQALTQQRRERGTLISRLDAEKESKSEEYQRLEADRDRLENLLAELRRRANALDGTAFAAAKGTLPMPTPGKIRHAFGSRRADGRMRWHGVDISASEGTPVSAVFRGRVIFADWLRGFGFLTILDHGSGYMTLYGHADTLIKKEGDWVESGEMIARAGNSGGRNNTGIYFEVRHKGQPQDPIVWVTR